MLPDSPIRVLHVDDEPGFADMVADFLEREDPQITVQTAKTVESAIEILDTSSIDCIVSDYEMPEANGLQFLHTVRNSELDVPFILFTGKGSEEIASDAISAGVTDYLQKEGGSSQYTLLAHRVTNAVSQYHSQREAQTTQERLSLFFEHSPLGAIEWNADFEITRINETAEALLGYDDGELVGASWRKLVPEPEQRSFAEMLAALNDGAAAYNAEHETVTKEGDRLVCEWHHRVIRNELGDVVTSFSKLQDITDRIERQQQLAQERAFTEQALDTLDDLFYVVDADGNLKRWNDQLAAEAGYDEEILAGRNILDFVADDHHSKVDDAIEVTMDQGTGTVEADLCTETRGRVPYELTGKRLTDPAADFVGVVGIGRDLSDRKEREAELEFARDLLDKTEQIADVGGWQIETATNDVYWSDHLFEMLGIDGDEAPSLDEALNVYLEADRSTVETAIEDAIASRNSFDVEARFERPDGEIRWFRILGEPTIEDDEVVRLRGAVQDITDHKRRERDLEQARTEYEELFNGMNDMAVVVGFDETFLAVNDTTVERTGYSRDELLSMGPDDIDTSLSSSEISELIDDIPADGTQVVETVHQTKHGEELPVELSSTVITYADQPAVLTIGREITERKERERQLEQFASVVSHDLRTPLSVAQGYLELAEDDCESSHLDKIGNAHARMETLIDELLTLAREGDRIGETEEIDLATFVDDCWGTIDTGSATLQIERTRRLLADRSRFKQIVENLVRNAVEHGGESVTVTVGALENGFFVADDGAGIPEHDRDEVFTPGYSTGTNGTGFGLSIVKEVADAHDWDIRVTESATGGARFEFTDIESPN